MKLHEKIFDLALKRSFFYPSNEPYGSVSGFYDYGPVGSQIKYRIEELWRKMFIHEEGYLEVQSAIITPEIVLKASGHVDSFTDPIFECQKCHTKVRADSFISDKVEGYMWDGKELAELDRKRDEHKLKCPKCGGDFNNAARFNLMFATGMGGERAPAYCRPETAQGIFTAFPRLFRNHGTQLPLAIGQVGKSFRNEISPRKGLVRMREFTQMELEYFFDPQKPNIEKFSKITDYTMRFKINGEIKTLTADESVKTGIVPNEIFAYFLVKEWEFYKKVGIDEQRMYFRVLGDDETPHYSKRNIDMEVETSFGIIETIGNAYRTDFDLSQHAKYSGENFTVTLDGRKFIPHVFEASLGVDRLFFCLLEHCFREASAEKQWEWFDLPPIIAPYDVAVYPLMKKDGLDEKAKEITNLLRKELNVLYSESGSIGKRYARADEIGVPYAVTIDYDTLNDNSVTIRYRNDGKQERVKIENILEKIKKNKENKKVIV
ncbi:MAG: glycine--tRNA ligase [Candidatus Bilamarchaeaceae archaeon]